MKDRHQGSRALRVFQNDLKKKVAIVVVSIARCKPIARKIPRQKSAKL